MTAIDRRQALAGLAGLMAAGAERRVRRRTGQDADRPDAGRRMGAVLAQDDRPGLRQGVGRDGHLRGRQRPRLRREPARGRRQVAALFDRDDERGLRLEPAQGGLLREARPEQGAELRRSLSAGEDDRRLRRDRRRLAHRHRLPHRPREDACRRPGRTSGAIPSSRASIGLYNFANSAGKMELLLASKIFGKDQYDVDAGFAALAQARPRHPGRLQPLHRAVVGRDRRRALRLRRDRAPALAGPAGRLRRPRGRA